MSIQTGLVPHSRLLTLVRSSMMFMPAMAMSMRGGKIA